MTRWFSQLASAFRHVQRAGISMAVILVLGMNATVARAQLTSPGLTTTSTTSKRPISAAEAAHHVFVKEGRLEESGYSIRTPDYPRDSLQRVVMAAGVEWLARIRNSRVQGVQLDPSGRLGVAAEQDAYAKQQIAQRLATPKLALHDRAFTYLTAVKAFADSDHPERLHDAEAYLKQLDALGDSAAYWQYHGHSALLHAYYLLGRPTDIIRHGMRAVELAPRMHFIDRMPLFDTYTYPAIVEALAGQPNGRARIASLNAAIEKAIVLPPALLALDTGYAFLARKYAAEAKAKIAVHALLGTQGQPLTAHVWLNRQTGDSASISVADGKIRIVDVSDYNCPACLLALDRIQRLQLKFPNIDVMMVTSTVGYWGNRLVSSDEEVKALTDYFLKYRKLTFPIGIWKAKKVVNEDGGMAPEESNLNKEHYLHTLRPTFFVLDGKGTIRSIIPGNSDDTEKQLARTITFLLREGGNTATTAAISTTPQ